MDCLTTDRDRPEDGRPDMPLLNESTRLRQAYALHEQDRQLMAYDIHDGLAQDIAGALMQFQCFREAHKTERGDVWQAFDAGTRLLTQGLAEARRLIAGLDPPLLEELGLVAAIEHLIGHDDLPRAVDIDFRHRLGPRRLPRPLENAAFRIVQESLTNARRHSKSPRIHIDLSVKSGAIRLIVQDWGVGFDPNAVRPEAAGLRGICGRARLLGGETRILSRPGAGTRIVVELPLGGS